ncbi:hypothetical protein MAHJHV55_16410 [Mycobacterium avium subsp. hominissuis]
MSKVNAHGPPKSYAVYMPQYMGIDHTSWERECPKCGGEVDWWFANAYRVGTSKLTAIFVPDCEGDCPQGGCIGLTAKCHTGLSRTWTPLEAGPLPRSQ